MQDEFAAPARPLQQRAAQRELRGVRPAEGVREPRAEALHRQRQHVVVQEPRHQRAPRRQRQRAIDAVERLGAQLPVAAEGRAVVRRRRVHAHHEQPVARVDGNAQLVGQELRHVVAAAIVVARHHRQPALAAQRVEERLEQLVLLDAPPSVTSPVTTT
ncbi:MAG: hypothetical protein AB1730_17375 [Myxococcota bacterium]